MFRTLELRKGDAHPNASEGDSRVRLPDDDTLVWIDLFAQDDASLELLRERFNFHPLAIEDCAHLDQRPKLEEYGDHVFLVTQGFHCAAPKIKDLELLELHAFLGKRYLVTVHAQPIAALEDVWRRAQQDSAPLERGVDFTYYQIVDRMVDAGFPILDRVTEELEDLEDRVLENPRKRDLGRIFELKRHLVTMRRSLSPQRDTIATLSRQGDSRVSEKTALYFRNVYDHLTRINESIESNRDLLGNALDAYLSAVSNRTNEIMKYLTILSAVFLPLSFIVGFFGQNFDNLPGIPAWTHSDMLMKAAVGLSVATPVVMILWFRYKRWL
jgi:magnesium transporter